jgi:hypothetical protein
MRTASVVVRILLVVVVAGCGYALPPPLQQQVDTLTGQAEGVYSIVRTVKAGAEDGTLGDATLNTVRKKYDELVGAHDDWRAEVKDVISKEMQNFEKDDEYQNSVRKLENASAELEKAADAAAGGTPADVPDWSVETRELINLAYNERKLKRAADLIYEDLRMMRWDEIKK